jgi:hypothetical protein
MNQSNDTIETRKCRYYNQGYCQRKNNFKYIHPTNDCEEDCSNPNVLIDIEFTVYGDRCYYNSLNSCKFKHDNIVQIINIKF